MKRSAGDQQGVQSLEIGFQLANVLCDHRAPMTFGEIASRLSLPASKIHRYLVSLCRAGILSQSPVDSTYRIGGGAIALGLAGQHMMQEYRLLDETMIALQRETGLTIGATVWGTHGPVVIRRVEPSDHSIFMSPRVGATISLASTASGRIFAAFLPDQKVAPVRDRELAEGVALRPGDAPITRSEFDKIIAKVRKEEVSSLLYGGLYENSWLSVPVFSAQGEIVFALGLVLPRSAETSIESDYASALKAAARRLEAGFGLRESWHRNNLEPVDAKSPTGTTLAG